MCGANRYTSQKVAQRGTVFLIETEVGCKISYFMREHLRQTNMEGGVLHASPRWEEKTYVTLGPLATSGSLDAEKSFFASVGIRSIESLYVADEIILCFPEGSLRV